jgi:hypothetical protein
VRRSEVEKIRNLEKKDGRLRSDVGDQRSEVRGRAFGRSRFEVGG